MVEPHKTASGTISESPLVLTDIVTDDGTTAATGIAWAGGRAEIVELLQAQCGVDALASAQSDRQTVLVA